MSTHKDLSASIERACFSRGHTPDFLYENIGVNIKPKFCELWWSKWAATSLLRGLPRRRHGRRRHPIQKDESHCVRLTGPGTTTVHVQLLQVSLKPPKLTHDLVCPIQLQEHDMLPPESLDGRFVAR